MELYKYNHFWFFTAILNKVSDAEAGPNRNFGEKCAQ